MTIDEFVTQIGFDYSNPIKCECYDMRCVKRKLMVCDFFTQKQMPILVCNGVVKLLIENAVEYKYRSIAMESDELVRLFFEKISIAYHECQYNKKNLFESSNTFYMRGEKSLDKINITRQILNRPIIYGTISLKKCIDILLEYETLKELDISTPFYIRKEICFELERFLISIADIKKYISLQQKVRSTLKKIKDAWNYETANILLLDALLGLFELEQHKQKA